MREVLASTASSQKVLAVRAKTDRSRGCNLTGEPRSNPCKQRQARERRGSPPWGRGCASFCPLFSRLTQFFRFLFEHRQKTLPALGEISETDRRRRFMTRWRSQAPSPARREVLAA